jgi:hypothetical protein
VCSALAAESIATVAECTVLAIVTVALSYCHCDWSGAVLCAIVVVPEPAHLLDALSLPQIADAAAAALAVSFPALAAMRLSSLMLDAQDRSLSVLAHTTCSVLTGSEGVLIGPTVVTVVPELAASGCTTLALGHTVAAMTVAVGNRGATDTVV